MGCIARAYKPSLFLLCMTLATLAACTHVRPYEREHLSKPSMEAGDERHEGAFQNHLRESREGATAGSSSAGGGCGCN